MLGKVHDMLRTRVSEIMEKAADKNDAVGEQNGAKRALPEMRASCHKSYNSTTTLPLVYFTM
jgi:hypothetical protein